MKFRVWESCRYFQVVGSWGGLLFVNILAAHFTRFRMGWRRVPLILIHGGIALLLIAEWVTGVFAKEMNLMFDEGQEKSYLEHPRETEFVLIDTSDAEMDRVFAVHESHLATGRPVVHETLPLRVEVRRFLQNSRVFLLPPETAASHPDEAPAERGLGPRLRMTEEPRVVSTDGRNVVSAVVEVFSLESDESLGTWAVSSVLTDPQTLDYDGRSYRIAIRPEREYLGYSLQLLEFTHLRYPGTQIPKHFASQVRLRNPQTGEDREIHISMNQPLRYRGKTFYQASYANDDQTSILQVVRNPGWTLPYIACLVVTVGLIWQLGLGISRRPRRKDAEALETTADQRPAPMGWLGWLAMAFVAVWICSGLFRSSASEHRPDLDTFGALPVLADGRLKSMDSMARGYLRALSGKTSTQTVDGERLDARE